MITLGCLTLAVFLARFFLFNFQESPKYVSPSATRRYDPLTDNLCFLSGSCFSRDTTSAFHPFFRTPILNKSLLTRCTSFYPLFQGGYRGRPPRRSIQQGPRP
jgi:hypothetical protein